MMRLREWLFSANSFLAAMLALYISLVIGLERPFWAMATVYIVSQPITGTVRSKAAYRFGGTLIGAAASVWLVPSLSNAPVLLSIALALWVCACQFLSLLDRTPRSYLFMLAGYTAALIGFPSVDHPDQIFSVALLRAQEIGVGVLCASLVHTVFFPRSVATVLTAKLEAISADAQAWIINALSGHVLPMTAPQRRTIAADITELHMLATHVPYDTDAQRPTRAALAALQDRLMLLVPLISALEDRIQSLKQVQGLTPALTALLEGLRAWVAADKREDPVALRTEIDQLSAQTPPQGWSNLLTHNLLARLTELIDLLRLSRELSDALSKPAAALSPEAQTLVGQRIARPLHVDYGMALLSTLATFAATVGCCLFWIMTGWPEGAIAPMIAAVMCCFFATMDDPTIAQRGFLTWTVASLPLIALYQFALLPAVHGFIMLSVVLAPPLLIMGALLPSPKWYMRMMPMVMGFTTGLALTNTFSADFAAFLNANFAQITGVAAAIFATRLLRVVGPHTVARRVLRAGWRELAAIAAARYRISAGEWTGLMLDRIQLLAPRLSGASTHDRLAASDALRDLRIGLNLLILKDLDGPQDNHIDAVLADVSHHFAALERDEGVKPDSDLRLRIDQALSEPRPLPTLVALTGLRRNLFPDAAPPLPEMTA
ncbi:FUSC family protein [Asticcacaulis sp. 201]|uniref:FUSC family protein n=1 Tax=Asticcacaulis sp. 201 TaxID=3028787 RepID=UPI002916D071|nr:FUSC family protein [Asticcacaulis sp. 201]MDV6330758.1 FUSC family protein [Asticcacaulis sp. 201]